MLIGKILMVRLLQWCKKVLCTNTRLVVYLLQTDPAYQRKGLASMLLKYGLAMADSEGRKAYIEATAEGHPVYLKLGFRDIDVLRLDLSKWGGTTPGVNTIMMRDPQPV